MHHVPAQVRFGLFSFGRRSSAEKACELIFGFQHLKRFSAGYPAGNAVQTIRLILSLFDNFSNSLISIAFVRNSIVYCCS